ncbi:MAG: thioredoxin family protein [Tepidisphaeraceae bacterium]
MKRPAIRWTLAYAATMLALAFALAPSTRAEESESQAAAAAQVGQAAPSFALPDQDGKTVQLSDFAGKVVVLEWFNEECPFVVKHYGRQHMNQLASKYQDKGVVWLAINSTYTKDVADNKKIAGQWKIDRPVLTDKSGEVGKAYGAKKTPHMYVIDQDGKLAYAGGIDDKPTADTKDIDGATNYVAKALDEMLEGKAVSMSETQAYGCGVKYAK